MPTCTGVPIAATIISSHFVSVVSANFSSHRTTIRAIPATDKTGK